MTKYYLFYMVYYSDCKDSSLTCPWWSSQGECKANPTWMLNNCKSSCGSCARSCEFQLDSQGNSVTIFMVYAIFESFWKQNDFVLTVNPMAACEVLPLIKHLIKHGIQFQFQLWSFSIRILCHISKCPIKHDDNRWIRKIVQ